MVCAYCGGETEVFNSRSQKRNNQVWRRRRCQGCGALFTTHESLHLSDVYSVKHGVSVVPFLPDKLYSEIVLALRDVKNSYEAAREVSTTVMHNLFKKSSDGLILPQDISRETASVLKRFDKQAWLRFRSEHPSLFDLR